MLGETGSIGSDPGIHRHDIVKDLVIHVKFHLPMMTTTSVETAPQVMCSTYDVSTSIGEANTCSRDEPGRNF